MSGAIKYTSHAILYRNESCWTDLERSRVHDYLQVMGYTGSEVNSSYILTPFRSEYEQVVLN